MKTEIIKWDLIDLANSGKFHAIAHGCNCFNSMSGGVAKKIADAFPIAREVDESTEYGSALKYGSCSMAEECLPDMSRILIFNLYTQYHPGGLNESHRGGIDDEHHRLASIRRSVGVMSKYLVSEFGTEYVILGIPKIGSGIAGGDWAKILPVIEDALKDVNGTLFVVEYEKDGKETTDA